jgi:cysteine synthase
MSFILVSVQTLIFYDSHEEAILLRLLYKSTILFLFSFFLHILAHFDQLAEEIFYQCDGHIDAIIVGAGTGGTIAGIGRKIKTLNSKTLIVAADPYGSILSIPSSLNIDAPPNKV